MKKQLILAAISAALVTAPFVDAVGKPSGFSSGKSSSSSSGSSGGGSRASTSSSSSSRASTSGGSSDWGNTSSTRASSSASPAPAPKRDYGSSWGSATPSRQAAPTRSAATDYAPASRVTPQLRQVEPTRVAPVQAAVPPIPAGSGFADTKSSSTKKKVAAVAGATALGGALYAAGANHEAVAAYQRSQEPAPVAPAPERTASTTTSHYDNRPTVQASAPTIHVPQQPQVIVVHESPRYNDHADDAYWYRRGRDSAAREARINTPTNTYGGSLTSDTPVVQQSPRSSQVSQPAAPVRSTTEDTSSGVGSFILYIIVILMVLGGMAYLAMQILNSDPTRKSKPARRKSNYTL